MREKLYATSGLFIAFMLCLTFLSAQSKLDSLQHVPEVKIYGQRNVLKPIIPAQILEGEVLKSLNSFSVADAIRYFAGTQLKDYGGIGGLKTVNIRSMGTHHVGVFYEGIQLGNTQNGQVDMGKFSMENIESISLYNGQKSNIFQPAKDFGASGTIYLNFRKPRFKEGEKQHFKTSFKTGSFCLLNPSILWERKLSKNINASFSSEYVYANGRYKYRYKRVFQKTGKTAYDTTAYRKNGDIYGLRLEGGLYGKLNGGNWTVKTYLYDSEKGIPGAIVNNVWKNSQRQWDTNFFVQGGYQQALTDKYDIMVKAKYANDRLHFLNPDTTLMYINNTFRQQEYYGSLAQKYTITPHWDASLAVDYQRNTLTSNVLGFVYPTRNTELVALATALDFGNFKAQASVLGTFVQEKVTSGKVKQDSISIAQSKEIKAAANTRKITPAIFASYKPLRNIDFTIRAFFKHIFRMPTFNDLYYTDIGNIRLKPELTYQYNLGFKYNQEHNNKLVSHWDIQLDAYYNEVKNKIVAVPKGSGLYRWMMMNLGEVEIRGVDLSSTCQFTLPKDILLNLKLVYTYQQAKEFTRRKNKQIEKEAWGGQINYIPWHSGSFIAAAQYKSWHLNYSFMYVGERYHNSVNILENYEQPWYTHDMSVVKNFQWKNKRCKVSAEINNLLNQYFDVVLNYPMPGRNYKLILSFEL